jgi:DNA-3-methyladenine glycosylase I
MMDRCEWCSGDEDYIRYHDEQWGVPVHSDRELFEMLTLEGAQAGLSWITILRRREGYRKAFHDFDIRAVSKMNGRDVNRLMKDPGIIRNRLKIESTISNALAVIKVTEEFGSFSDFIWQFTGGKTIHNRRTNLNDLPASTRESDLMSKELRKRGFRFTGSTICYAFMQATGMVNDHITSCYRYKEIKNADNKK